MHKPELKKLEAELKKIYIDANCITSWEKMVGGHPVGKIRISLTSESDNNNCLFDNNKEYVIISLFEYGASWTHGNAHRTGDALDKLDTFYDKVTMYESYRDTYSLANEIVNVVNKKFKIKLF